jgi:hypothetical protein
MPLGAVRSDVRVGLVNVRHVPHQARSRARHLALAAASLSVLLVATSLPVLGEYDPGRPTSNEGSGSGESPARRVALGVARPDVGIGELDSFTAAVGARPAIWVIWSQWGRAATKDFPMAEAKALRDRGVQPMIWWEPVKPGDLSDPTYPRHRNIIAGDHDAYIREFARDARDFGEPVLLRFAHEINNDFFPWSVNSFDNSPATFKSAWRHVVDIFRSEGASNVKFVWSVAKKSCAGGCNPYLEVYPGDAYVDVMGFSGYNWGTHPGKSWISMYESFRRVTSKLREVSSKPIMAAETGSNPLGGDKAAWIRDGYRRVYAELPDIEAIVYLDADLRDVGHPDWRIASPAAALTAYAEIAGLARFDTRSPFGARADKKAAMGKQSKRVKKTTKQQSPASVAKNGPRVHRGNAVDDTPRDPRNSAARSAKSKTTTKPKQKPAPPGVLDPFSR